MSKQAIYTVVGPDQEPMEVLAPDDATMAEVQVLALEQWRAKRGVSDKKTQAEPESDAYRAGRAGPNWWRKAATALDGTTLGWGDEIVGGLHGVGSLIKGKGFQPGYEWGRDVVRGAVKQEETDSPMLATGLKLAGTLPTLAINPVGGLFRPVTMLGRAGLAALQGGVSGAVSGAGSSEADTLGGVLKDTGTGAATGTVLSGLGAPVVEVLGKGVRTGASMLNRGVANRYAQEKVAEALLRDAPGRLARDEVFDSGSTAAQRILGADAAKLARLGEEGRVVDAGGRNTLRLLDTLATQPGRTANEVAIVRRARAANAGQAMRDVAERELNPSGLRLLETVDDLVARREAAAAPLYDRVRRMVVKADDELISLIARAERTGATGVGEAIASNKGRPWSLALDDLAPGARLRVEDLDHVKRGLDKLISDNIVPTTGRPNALGESLMELRSQLLNRLDGATGGASGVYARARAAFAGPSALIDAANLGKTVLSKDDASITKMLRDLSESEREAFRIGAWDALRAKLGTGAGQNQMLAMWREPTTREKLKALFGTEREFRRFSAEVARQGKMKRIQAVDTGSMTAARAAGAADLDNSAIEAGTSAASAISNLNPLAAAGPLARVWNSARTPEPVRDAMGDLLLSRGAQGRQNLLSMEQILEEVRRARARNAGAIGLMGGYGTSDILTNP